MLSIMKVSNVKQASTYYNSPDKYYSKDGADIGSEWHGKGAGELGLNGDVVGEDFVRLLEGRINANTHLGKVTKDGEIDHVPGWDFTFSAPKSVSILALVAGDERLVQAHLEASKKAIAYIEKNYAMTRISEGGETRYQKVDNLIVASFTHTESRKNDPQLHTHNVVMNAVQDGDGQWRSLETLRMFEGKLMSGLIYRYELANLVKSLGYDIDITDREKGFFDIKGVPGALMDMFSKRRQQVVESAQQRGLFDQKSMERATLYSRDAKKTPEREALLEDWKETVHESGADLKGVIEQSKENALPTQDKVTAIEDEKSPADQDSLNGSHNRDIDSITNGFAKDKINDHLFSSQSESLLKDVRLAYRVLAESEAVFNSEDLTKEVMKLTIGGGVSPDDIGEVLNAMVSNGELLPRVSRTKNDELAFTTPHAFEIERHMLSLMLNGKDSRPSIGTTSGIEEHIRNFEHEKSLEFGSLFQFSPDQRKSIIEMATNKDLVSGIQGFAGTGKTTLLQCLIGYAEEQGYKVKGFGPTGSAKDTLSQETGIHAQTVDSFLFRRNQGEVSTNEIWLIDEMTLVNGSNAHKMLAEADRSGAKVVMLGDKHQLESVEWGKAFSVLQTFGMHTSKISTIIRQKQDHLLEAVHESINKNWSNVFNNLKETTYDYEKRSLLDDYLALSPEERSKTLVVIPDNAGRQNFNSKVHEHRIENGDLSAEEHGIKVLVNANLNAEQRRDARYFTEGQLVEFQKDHEDFKAGEFWSVIGKDSTHLIVSNDKGETRKFDPSSLPKDAKFSLDVFTASDIKVSPGEVLKVNKTRKVLDLSNGEELTVKSGNPAEQTLTLVNEKGEEIEISTKDLHNLDYNYAHTAFGVQGKTIDRVMAVIESWRRNLVNFRSVYVTLSRARHEAHLYVDDVEHVIENLNKHHADKSTSLTGMSRGDMKRDAEHRQQEHKRNWQNFEQQGDQASSVQQGLQGQKNQDKPQPDYRHLFADLEFVTEKLSLRQGVFSHTDLLKETLKHSIGTYDVRDVEKGINIMRSRGDLGLSRISGEGRKAENFYTLPTNIRLESQVVRHMLQGQDRLPAIIGKGVVESYVKARNERAAAGECEAVSPEAGEALSEILSSRHETVLVLGTDHSGHRDLMRGPGRLLAESEGYKVRAFSTNTEGVQQLRESVSNAQNIYAHIGRLEDVVAAAGKVNSRREVWVVENASQLGTEDTLRLQQVARYAGARVMLIADKQENSLSWGSVPTLLMENGMEAIKLGTSFRAKNQDINLATDALAQGKLDKALDHVGHMVEAVNAGDNPAENRNARIEVLSNTFLNLDDKDRSKTAIVVPDYFTRNKVDLQIRKGLQSAGILKGDTLTTTLYRNANMDLLEKRKAQYYKTGQVIEFESARNGAQKGEYFTIKAVNPKTNVLTLESHSTGQAMTLDVDEIAGSRGNSIRVYHAEEKSLAVGEQIRFNKTASKDRLIGTDKNVPSKLAGTIKAIEGDHVTLKIQNGREVKLSTQDFKHLEYGYTHNLYDVKDKRFENVVTLMESHKKHFATQAALHNVLTKSTLNLKIITDDKGKLLESLKHNGGFQHIALHDRKVSIGKEELNRFDNTFGLGLTPVNRGLMRLENAFSKAVKVTTDKIIEKGREANIIRPVPQRHKQRSL
ncbi:conjugative relaxase-like TrwC/TraI family protein [Rahnella inusitata]|nr:conjugative relaxase-like TrwC/TraI family protein [Rahnella inusitata]